MTELFSGQISKRNRIEYVTLMLKVEKSTTSQTSACLEGLEAPDKAVAPDRAIVQVKRDM